MAPTPGNSTGTNYGNNGDPGLQCSPATTWSIFIFFASNYLAHVATVKTYPGESAIEVAVASALALFVPSSGIIRAIDSMLRRSRFRRKRNPLEQAARAGALRMVVRRSYWVPRRGDVFMASIPGVKIDPNKASETRKYEANPQSSASGESARLPSAPKNDADVQIVSQNQNSGPQSENDGGPIFDTVTNVIKETEQQVDLESLPSHYVEVQNLDYQYVDVATSISSKIYSAREVPNLHGAASLPFGYAWASVPSNAVISFSEPRSQSPGAPRMVTTPPSICSNYKWMQSLIAIFQAGSAGLTLYKSRGDQIQRYGYSAFGLTVVPYLVMSILNLISQMATADYPSLYMVRSPEMDEARRHGGVFDGVVGSLVPADQTQAHDPFYRVKAVVAGDDERILTLEKIDPTQKAGNIAGKAAVESVVVRVGYGQKGVRIGVRWVAPFKFHDDPATGIRKGILYFIILPVLLSSISLVVVGCFSHFAKGDSTHSQRAWIMSWLVIGIASGVLVDWLGVLFLPAYDDEKGRTGKCQSISFVITGIVVLGGFFVPAIGGFVVVGNMLKEYGICESG